MGLGIVQHMPPGISSGTAPTKEAGDNWARSDYGLLVFLRRRVCTTRFAAWANRWLAGLQPQETEQ